MTIKDTLIAVATSLLAASASSFADDALDPRVVTEAARRLQIPPEQVQDVVLHECDDGSWANMYRCSEYWRISEDLAMNDLFKQLMEARKGESRQMLLKAQRTWLAFRDASCAFEASGSAGGVEAAVDASACARVATQARNAQLREYASCSANGCP